MKNMPPSKTQRTQGFTLVEMIGVLAVIAILASLLVPRIFQAINDSKVSNAAAACNTVKSAVNEYYGKKGRFEDAAGAQIAATTHDWQTVLLKERFLEKPLDARVGAGAGISIINVSALVATTDPAADITAGGAFNLDGDAVVNDITGAGFLAQVSITNVTVQDARDLSLRLDGKELSSPDATPTAADSNGRVKYTVTDGIAQVAVYVAHR